jgi:hypothetical protein
MLKTTANALDSVVSYFMRKDAKEMGMAVLVLEKISISYP